MSTTSLKRSCDESDNFISKKIKHNDVVNIDRDKSINGVLKPFCLYDPMTHEVDLDPDKVVGKIDFTTHGKDSTWTRDDFCRCVFCEAICKIFLDPDFIKLVCYEELPPEM